MDQGVIKMRFSIVSELYLSFLNCYVVKVLKWPLFPTDLPSVA